MQRKLMPLTQKVTFRTSLEKGNRLQIAKLIRWQFKIESSQILRVTIDFLDLGKESQFFYAKMGKDGRILVPMLIILVVKGEELSLAGQVMEVTLEPL